MKTAIVALSLLAAAVAPAPTAPRTGGPAPVACYDLGVDSGCTYLLARDEHPALVFVQHEYAHCLTQPHGPIFEDGSIAGCPAVSQ